MTTAQQLFNELLNMLETRQNDFKERNRESSRRWRERQHPEDLKAMWRKWEHKYRKKNESV